MSSCPRCKTVELRHALLMPNLPGHSCPKCSGVLVSLVAYRNWRENNAEHLPHKLSVDTRGVTEDLTELAHCTKCRGVMTKYRMSSTIPNRVDYCAHCDELWLDHAEWEALEAIVQAGHLTRIVTEPWQRHVHEEQRCSHKEQLMQEKLGPDFAKVRDFSDWLHNHPKRNEIIAYLQKDAATN